MKPYARILPRTGSYCVHVISRIVNRDFVLGDEEKEYFRNLMRVLEFQFPAVAILVFLTPSRQRLGDVLSRTLVVQRVSVVPVEKEVGGSSEETKE